MHYINIPAIYLIPIKYVLFSNRINLELKQFFLIDCAENTINL